MVPPFTKQLHPVFLPAMQACNVKLMCTARANLREECRHPPFSASRLNKICCIINFAFSAVFNMLLLSYKPPSSSIPFKICLHYTSSMVHPLQKKPGSAPAVHLAVNILEKRKQKDIVGGQVIMEATLFYQITP